MAETTVNLGFLPKNRGEYQSNTRYYKDNIVQYNGSSYICDPVGYSDSNPTDTYTTIAPTDSSGNLNAGWRVFASGNNTFTTGESVTEMGIDYTPTAESDNLVTSGGVQNELALGAVYDVSAKNPTAGPNNDGKFTSLSALLSDANLNTLIPVAVRKGGMSIKFIQTYDNKYVQYRLMSDTFNTTVANWQGVDDEPTAESENLVKSGGVHDALFTIDKKVGTTESYTCPVQNSQLYGNFDFKLNANEDAGLLVDADNIYQSGTSITFYIYKNEEHTVSVSASLSNKHQYSSVRSLFSNYDGAIYGFALWITGAREAGNIIATFTYYGLKTDVATLQDDVAALQTDVSVLQDKIQASKDLIVSSSGQQQIYLKEKNWGKKIAVRIVENTATLDSGTVILCQARTGASSSSKNLSSEYVSFETLVDIDRIYIFNQGAITGAGTITVEIVNGDSYYLTIIDAAPTSNSKKLVESGGVFDAIQQLGDNLDERIVLLDDEVNGINNSQNFGFNINATPVDYSKTVDIKAGKYNIIVEDNNNILPSNTYLYLDGINKGYVKSISTPLTIESNVSSIRLWINTAASDSGNIILRFEDTEPTKSLEEKIEDVDEKYNGEIAKLNAIYEYTSYLESERFEISANKNNDGNSQYIYKEFPVEVASDELLVIECNSVTGCRASVPFSIKGQKDGQSVYIAQYAASAFNGRCKKRVNAVDSSITNVHVQLYASTDGGLTDTYTVFEGLKIYKSKSGSKDLEKDYATYDKNTIPAYYLANNYLKNKIDTIRQLMSDSNGNYDAFIFNTDQHWRFNTRNSPSVIKYIADYITINRIFMGGDTADGINLDCYKAFRDAFPGNIYYTAGNHEYMNYFEENDSQKAQDILGGDIWMYYQSHMDDAVIGAANKNYYYVDNQTQKMRYIILNVFTDGSVSEFTDTQRDWLRDVALNVPSGYTVVIFTHHLRSSFGVVDPSTAGKIINVIDNYSGNGDIVAVIQGHTHYDFVWQTAGGNNVVATTCDKNEGREDWGDEYLEDDRTVGTITEIAFDVVVVDKTHKKATFVRIGAPAYNDDRTRDSSKDLEERAVVYEVQAVAINETITLTPGIIGTWTSSNDTIASVSDGVVTGIAEGIAIITVVDSTNHRAVWYTVKVS